MLQAFGSTAQCPPLSATVRAMTFRAVASASAVGTVASKKKLRRGLWYEGGREGAAEIRCEFASLIQPLFTASDVL